MQVNKYCFCGCKLEIISDESIIPEGTFSLFKSDFSSADYSVKIIKTNILPSKTGTPLFISDRQKIYFDKKKQTFTAYYDTHNSRYTDFACKSGDDTLYINYPDELRETTVFDGLNLPSILIQKGIGIMHCSFIEYDNSAILFAGNKQVGKSTQASLWKTYADAETINGDRAALIIENGKVYACGIPFCGTSKICKNKKLPVKAIICLSKGDENSIEKLSPIKAFTSLLGKFTYNHSDTKESEIISGLTAEIAEMLPVYAYSCLKEQSSVYFLKDLIYGT